MPSIRPPEAEDWHLLGSDGLTRTWVFQLCGKLAAAFLPQGFLDLWDRDTNPGNPPNGRVRLLVVGSRVSVVDSSGAEIAVAFGPEIDAILTTVAGEIIVDGDGNLVVGGP